MTNVIEANDTNFVDETSTGLVLVDFWAAWCGPCKMVSPMLDAISTERSDIKIVKVNVDQSPESTKKFAVRGIPALFVLKDGAIVSSKVGGSTKAAIVAMIDQAAA